MTTELERVRSGLFRAAWGYIFLYFNININQVSLLPAFVGYILFLAAIAQLRYEEWGLTLIHTLGVMLVLWNAADWMMSWMGMQITGRWPFVDLIASLINLYFQFQFVTNLAAIAAKFQPPGYEMDAKLLTYRTWQTVILTVATLLTTVSPWLSEVWGYALIVIGVVYLVFGICLIKALFDLRRCVQEPQTEDAAEPELSEVRADAAGSEAAGAHADAGEQLTEPHQDTDAPEPRL